MTTCQALRIIGKHEGVEVFDLVVPAYTRTDSSLRNEVAKALDFYVASSVHNAAPMSVADFALRLLSIAENEPREQSEPG